ncbi:hypothetical protein SUGI_0480690 [Cryptomeria japonica]|uniref:putative UDP-glucuronate:xylan alpha-glucuronosyltransferase 3 n=1 Tax=Cryptomeria japonica TaxID=3369 RepID=UPI002408989F|nr:putative UDP-glucuronate:xylan alpha-glucuronosyltransferase 3 [Cryptomeria japonica]XP_057845145.2 putative UDP-glucuronate:xylan alpha-glucuronosyltransferase 3 [Cryptomeria japonica]GLJ25132.1 hypothetical protein SUGI_0480690 [Cryptomeria japonica]
MRPSPTPPTPQEPRHRQAGPIEDGTSRRTQAQRHSKDSEKGTHSPRPDRNSNLRLFYLRLALILIICGTLVTLLCSPAVDSSSSHLRPRSRFGEVGWLWERNFIDERYVAVEEVDWSQVSKYLASLNKLEKELKVGLLNFGEEEVQKWQQLAPGSEFITFTFDYARRDVKWETLYPEWIDEDEAFEVPKCPQLHLPKVPKNTKLDVVAAKLPCRKWEKNWSRDVARLHLQLAAANLAVSSKGHGVYVLLITEWWPSPNIFTCKDLISHENDTWLYKPNASILKSKLKLPVGSCQLAVPLKAKVRPYSGNPKREAYATILHSAEFYVCGAIAVARSIRLTGSKRDLVILVDATIIAEHRRGLEMAGWKLRQIERIRNPKAEREAYNEWNYSKFRLWQLTDYDKIIFIDADLLILRNIDFLFGMPEITATGNNATLFNSGVMVIEPSNCTFQLLMDHINDIESYNGGDQGYLNEIFTWWHRMPKHMNFLKHFWSSDADEKELKTYLFGADPPVLYVLHYLGLKPWLCFRDFDCNWNNPILQEFASDVAHARWWKVHDSMPESQQQFCLLRSKQKAFLEWDRRQAEAAKLPDEHWKRNITDPRLQICNESFCFWESMLWHWGEANYTENATTEAPPKTVAL